MSRRGELPVLPRAVATERRIIQLFLAYLKQPASQDAILGAARAARRLEEVANYINTLEMYTGRPDADLRALLTAAPALQEVVTLTYGLRAGLFPDGTVPSGACIDAAQGAYHRWVRSRAGR